KQRLTEPRTTIRCKLICTVAGRRFRQESGKRSLAFSPLESLDPWEAIHIMLSEILAEVGASGTITAGNTLAVRGSVYGGDAAIAPDEFEEMLALDAKAKSVDPNWTQLLSEAGADFVVNQQPPSGHVSEDNAAWLTERITRDGIVNTSRQLELLV